MTRLSNPSRFSVFAIFIWASAATFLAADFSVATFNLENYLEVNGGSRPGKSPVAKAKIRASIHALNADVLALQEIGGTNALSELRSSLKREGIEYPYWELVAGFDTNIQVAVLSKFPITVRRPHPNEGYLMNGRHFRVSRGFAEIDIRVQPQYQFTLLTAHLKSRRPVPEADEADLREQEALLLREIIEARLSSNPDLNLIVLGDFNDVKDARSTKAIMGKGKHALIDTRPAERNGDDPPNATPYFGPRQITWTHYYGKEDTYSRIDYILISRGMAREWNNRETYVLAIPNWGVASDHRPIVAGFFAEDK